MIQASSSLELIESLAAMDIAVPARTKGRTKEYTERYAIAHFLSTLAEAGDLRYPMTVSRRERPDFVLVMGGKKIGIEHTEAVAQNEAYKDAIREEGHGPPSYWLSHSRKRLGNYTFHCKSVPGMIHVGGTTDDPGSWRADCISATG